MAIALSSYIGDPALYPSVNQPPADITGIDGWTSTFGAYPTLVLDYLNWPAVGDFGAYPNPNYAADNYTDYGAFAAVPRQRGVPLFIKWQPASATAISHSTYDSTTWNPFKLSTIASGVYDPWIAGFAKDVASRAQPIIMSFGHEMNGNWYPWGCAAGNGQGNTAAQFVSAWIHVWQLFQTAGANRYTKWAWCTNYGYGGSYPILTAAYPGDAYVDWIGWDGYNSPGIGSFQQFKTLMNYDYALLTGLSATKPLMVAECSCRDNSISTGDAAGAKADWINQLFEINGYSGTGLSAFPRVQAFLWYDQNAGGSYILNTDATSRAAWAKAAQDTRYQGVMSPDLGSVVTRASTIPGSPTFAGGPTFPGSPVLQSAPVNKTSATYLFPKP